MEETYKLDHLDKLEAESIQIFREVAASFKKPVMLYSVGKDSSVILKLAQKAFAPGRIPFPMLHVYTGYQFPEMITFRDYYLGKIGAELLVSQNLDSEESRIFGDDDTHTDQYIYQRKTKPLLDAIEQYGFDAAIGGARREEEKARAKERVFSVREGANRWDPKNQRPELWHIYNTTLAEGQTMRVFPISNWTEADIWAYIKRENIEIVPLYFAEQMKVVRRNGIYVKVDDFIKAKDGEEIIEGSFRFRTLGCQPSTGAVASTATTLDEIIEEVLTARQSERQNRAIDATSESSMEKKKREGYF